MKNILVTGGAGFIGSHICIKLLENNYRITVFDSYINSSPISLMRIKEIVFKNDKKFNERLEIINGDLKDFNSINNLFSEAFKNKKSFDGVIHLAGLKSASESIDNPLLYWDSNLIGTINLLKAMSKYGCKTIIFSSSAAIYGLNNNLPFYENNIINPISPYGNTKYFIEKILNDLYKSSKSKYKIACLRYFNPIGAHHSGKIGEDPNNVPNNIFPLLIKVAQGKIDKFTIFGNDWPTLDGTAIRDYIHIVDLAEAHFLTLEFLERNKPQYVEMNIGTGKGTSVLELLEIFQKVNQIKIPYIFSSRRKGDSGIVYADNSLAKKLLNWEPTKSVEEMCRDGWNWQLNNPNGFK